MVLESYPWKQDLIRRKSLIIRYNKAEKFEHNYDGTYTIIEKGIFYSAFIIRKLIDCGGKLSDDADRFNLTVKTVKPVRNIDILHRIPDMETHDWDNAEKKTVPGKDVCNWLIHSFVFVVMFDESGTITSFCVSSDYDRNKVLYMVELDDWLNYIDFIASDDIIGLNSKYNEKKKDMVYTKKERGKR